MSGSARREPALAVAGTFALVLGMATLAGCAVFQTDEEELREEIVETALDQVGEDYEYGGADPSDGFDCSGLVYYSYAQNGIKLPRSAAQQRKAGKQIKFSEAQPGDLLFYRFGTEKAGYWHVVMFIGDGEGVHAPVRDGEVEVIEVTEMHWRKRFVSAVRILKPA
jgi:cell wall-associated NlpC family hydrolase